MVIPADIIAGGIVTPSSSITGIICMRGEASWQDRIRIVVKQITTKPEMPNAKNGNFS